MFFKYAIFFCVFLIIVDSEAFVKRESSSTTESSLNLDKLKKNMDAFRNCIDQSLASVVGDVNEDHLQPLFNVIGDHLNRFSKAFEDLKGPSSTSAPDE